MVYKVFLSKYIEIAWLNLNLIKQTNKIELMGVRYRLDILTMLFLAVEYCYSTVRGWALINGGGIQIYSH